VIGFENLFYHEEHAGREEWTLINYQTR